MQYDFPVITNINDVLPAITDDTAFVVVEKDGGYTVINYVIQTTETFPVVESYNDAVRRECRGLIFNTETGKVISRPYHKFFNLGERDETQIGAVDFSKSHSILEKLDGSLVRPMFIGGGWRLGTKMGITDVSNAAETVLVSHPQYENYIKFFEYCEIKNTTPCFEFISPRNKIVVEYVTDDLVLTAIRNNITGDYDSYTSLCAVAEYYGIRVVQAYAGTAKNMEQLLSELGNVTDMEGYVVRFDTGHMVKVKGDWYVRLHRVKDSISREKNVLDIILNETSDDVKAFMDEKDRVKFVQFEDAFWHNVTATVASITAMANEAMSIHKTKRDYAVQFVQHQEQHLRPFLYGLFDGKDCLDMVKDCLKKSLATQTKVDEARWIFGGDKSIRWAGGMFSE